MPILKDFRTTKTIELPSFPGSKVEIYDSLLVGDMIVEDKTSEKYIENLINVLPKLIKSWNFTDEEEKPLPIDRENLNFLHVADITFVSEQIAEFNEDIKKKLSTLQPLPLNTDLPKES